MNKPQEEDIQKENTEEQKPPMWKRAGARVGNAFVNVLSGMFNVAAAVGVVALVAAQHGDNPVDGLNNILTQDQIDRMETRMTHQQRDTYYPAFLKEKQYTFYGDTNHTVGEIRDFFFGEENTSYLINSGVKHVFIEYPDNLQYIVTELEQGVLTKEEFVEELTDNINPLWWNDEQTKHYHTLMADMIVTLHEAGASMHFVDPGLGNSGMKQESKELLFEIAGEMVGVLEEDGINGSMSSMEIFFATQKFIYTKLATDPDFEKKLEDLYTDFFEQRLGKDNERIAANIEAIAGDDRSVILYGAAHIMREHDLDEMLGEDKSQTISLYKNKHDYADFFINALYSLYLPERAQRIHDISGGGIHIENTLYDEKLKGPDTFQPQM